MVHRLIFKGYEESVRVRRGTVVRSEVVLEIAGRPRRTHRWAGASQDDGAIRYCGVLAAYGWGVVPRFDVDVAVAVPRAGPLPYSWATV